MAVSARVPSLEVRSFRDLEVWQEAMDLVVRVHKAVRGLPQEQRFELGREMRRSATSIPSNVAEGFNRHARKVYRAHVAIALGSTGELETQLEVARRCEYLDARLVASLIEHCETVGRLAQGLWRSLKPEKKKPRDNVQRPNA